MQALCPKRKTEPGGGGGGGGGGGKAVDFQQLEIGGVNQIAAMNPCKHMTLLQAFTFTAVLTRNIICCFEVQVCKLAPTHIA